MFTFRNLRVIYVCYTRGRSRLKGRSSIFFSSALPFPSRVAIPVSAEFPRDGGIFAGFPRVFRAVVIKALLNFRRGNHV
jgi:hypothetical protein